VIGSGLLSFFLGTLFIGDFLLVWRSR